MSRDEAITVIVNEMRGMDLPVQTTEGVDQGAWRFLEDAGMDSLDEAELVMEIEDALDLDLDLDALDYARTVGEMAVRLVDAVERMGK